MPRNIAVIGVPSSAGAYAVGQEQAPRALRAAGLIARLEASGADVDDMGDSPVWRWRPDRARPRAQNVQAVIDQVRSIRPRVARAAQAGRVALVVGGDCTVGIGTIAGAIDVFDSVGVVYFDLHADMNTPASVDDGALDWMGVAHMLALEGTEPDLVRVGPRLPILAAEQLVLFGHGMAHATPWERQQIERLDISRVAVEEVRDDADAAAHRALDIVRTRFARYLVHLDVDVIDFTDAPLSENTGRNTGLSFGTAIAALRGLLADEALVALTVAEVNPAHAAAEAGLLERFAAAVAEALELADIDSAPTPTSATL